MSKWNADASSYYSLVAALNGRFENFFSKVKKLNVTSRPFLSLNKQLLFIVMFFFASLCISIVVVSENYNSVLREFRLTGWGKLYFGLIQFVLITNLGVFIWRCILVYKYSPHQPCTDSQLPVCSIIVPAYNEGKHVLRTLRSIARSSYPIDKLQIIAIDDGSIDDTWHWINKASSEFSNRIEAIRMPVNSGKKKALYEGFVRSRGDIIVTIDSDSLIQSETLRHLVSPLVRDEKIGAVSGNVRVLNRGQGIIPKMLDVIFVYDFDFMRSSQSSINSVICTPGAVAAYRRAPLMAIADSWLEQTFMGRPSTIGEDRALTNWILRKGFHVTYQSDAIAYTRVPVNYKNLCKMYLRWTRSYIRESIEMGKFIFGNFRETSAVGARVNFILSWINLVIPQILLLGLIPVVWHYPAFLQNIFASTLVVASAPAAFFAMRYNNKHAFWAYAHNFFCLIGLFWIVLYSFLTINNDKWLTRNIDTQISTNV
jgi:hyaluronan synthase